MQVLEQINNRIPKMDGASLQSLKTLLLGVIELIDRETRSREQIRMESRVVRKGPVILTVVR